jgi:hypothetical protein
MGDPRDIPGHRPDNDREQLAALGDSATIRPVSATRRNCWTCLHNLTAAGGYNYCGSPLYTGSAPDGAYRAVAEWIERYADDMDDGMPAKTADGCPGWVAKDEQATVKDSLMVQNTGWRGHLPLCRGPGGTMARRMAALVRARR